MPILINLDLMLAEKRFTLAKLRKAIGCTMKKLIDIKTGNIKAINLEILDKICLFLECKPDDILIYVRENALEQSNSREKRCGEFYKP